MAITIADRKQIRLVTDFSKPQNGQALPALLATVAMTNPGPVMIDTSGVAANGQGRVKQAAGTPGLEGYIGFNPDWDVPAGGPVSPCRGVLVEGFAGVLPGKPVFVNATSADASGTASGLTQTQPTQAGREVLALSPGTQSATAAFTLVAPEDGTLSAAKIVVKTTVTTSDTDYWTFAIVNKGQSGSGSTAMLAATDANTSKATGGSAITAYTARALSLNGTPANLAVAAGDVLEITATKSGSAANLVELGVDIELATTVGALGYAIGTGWSTTKIFFF